MLTQKTYVTKKPKVFYGYWVLVAAFFCVFIWAVCVFFHFSLFVKPLEVDFGWGRGEIMIAFTILCIVVGLASPLAGRLVDRYGARKVIAIGALIGGLGLALLNLTHNLWYFYIGYAVIGIGMAATGPVPATAIVSNWFNKRRGLAIGIMGVGMGAGGLALAPLIGGYLIPNFGWRVSYLVLAVLTWILIPLALFVIRTKPADMGLHPDGAEAPEIAAAAEASSSTPKGFTLKMALATSPFWLITISFLLGAFSHTGIMQNQVPHLEDIGFSAATAATALGVVGLAGIIGNLSFGWLCDRMQLKYALSISLGLQLAAVIILMNIKPESSLAMIWLYAITLGLGTGAVLPTMSIFISRSFGLASYGAIFGVMTMIAMVGSATGPLMAGYMYDAMNTYHWAFIIFIALLAVAIPIALAVRRPR